MPSSPVILAAGYGAVAVHSGVSSAGPVISGTGLTTIEKSSSSVWPVTSVTVTRTAVVPTSVGVPEMTPVVASISSPGGSWSTVHVYGVVPYCAVIAVSGYWRPIVQSGNESGPKIAGGGLIVTL